MSYDDEHSVRLKAEFAFDMKLGGVMVWSVETDDFKVNFIIIICIIIADSDYDDELFIIII